MLKIFYDNLSQKSILCVPYCSAYTQWWLYHMSYAYISMLPFQVYDFPFVNSYAFFIVLN